MKQFVVLILTSLALAGRGQVLLDRPQNQSSSALTYQEVPVFKKAAASRQKPALDRLPQYELLEADPRLMQFLLDEQPESLLLPIPSSGQGTVELELQRVEILTADFQVQLSAGNARSESGASAFYRGVIRGKEASVATLSVFPEGMQGMFSAPEMGDHHITQNPVAGASTYLLYEERQLRDTPVFECYTEDSYRGYSLEEIAPQADLRAASPCVRLYLEVDYDVYQDKGSVTATENYIKGLFNEVAALYSKENIRLVLSQLFIWNSASPYSGTDIYKLLTQFQTSRTSINGDAGQLLTYKGSGGIAVVDGLCRSSVANKLGVSSIDASYKTVPSYSFSVMVVAHELGHILGSQHTHACVWNGNNTAIDGCPGYVEGSCAVPALPAGGGTIMSYCHVSSVGINMSNGFGTQPGNLIRSRIAGASCLQTCTADTTGTGNQACDSLILTLVLDNYGSETSWQILNAQNQAVAKGGPYTDKAANKTLTFKLCLPYGCYTLSVKDSYGDGLCCSYGSGSFKLAKPGGQVLASGGQFTMESKTAFCLQAPAGGGGSGGGTNPVACQQIDFASKQPAPFGAGQDAGKATVLDAGRTLLIENNAWKMMPIPYEIKPTTVLAFDFRSTRQGEIHGIGFDNDLYISSQLTFQLYGNQAWGLQNYRNYDGRGNWKSYVIPVGKFYTGKVNYLFFAADHDIAPANGDAYFRYVRIYEEGTPCAARLEEAADISIAPHMAVFPNPASDRLSMNAQGLENGPAALRLYNFLGQELNAWTLETAGGQTSLEIPANTLDNGTYLLRLQSGKQMLTKHVVIQR
ncbi:MAG: T9SS type A sorting domain-containing protein [Haliscomenobacter sp.]|nr:T9SS type A sorting domain-containing protein [Haliscomenobacter sp.]MBP9874434.1 T9SS type A sorting domain-containing protein [Haliscomenobacter sp.]